MIYTVSEWLATISESLIIFFFLVKILSYKPMARSKKIIGTVVFCCLQCTSSLILDQFFVFEGLYVIITIFIYLLFCLPLGFLLGSAGAVRAFNAARRRPLFRLSFRRSISSAVSLIHRPHSPAVMWPSIPVVR